MKQFLLIFSLGLIVIAGRAQSDSGSPFYKHYLGTINQSVSVVFNLYRTGDELEGSYYYLTEGKALNLYGKMTGDTTFSIGEIDRSGRAMCSFNGYFRQSGTVMEGFWNDTTGILKRDFYAKEAYDSGTIHFDLRLVKMAKGADSNVIAYEVIQPIAKEMKSAKAENEVNVFIDDQLYSAEADALYNHPPDEKVLKLEKSKDFEKYGQDFIAFQEKIMITEQVTGPFLLDHICYIDYNAHNLLGLQFALVDRIGRGAGTPSVNYFFHNLDCRSGKELWLPDIFKKGYEPYLRLTLIGILQSAYHQLRESKEIDALADDLLKNHNFYLSEKGIGFLRNEFAPTAENMVDAFVPYTRLTKWIKPGGPLGWAVK